MPTTIYTSVTLSAQPAPAPAPAPEPSTWVLMAIGLVLLLLVKGRLWKIMGGTSYTAVEAFSRTS